MAASAGAQVQWTPRGVLGREGGRAAASANGRVLVFGGMDVAGGFLSDTAEWDGRRWVRRAPRNHPSARQQHGLAFDAKSRVTILYGGNTGGTTARSDTWVWDGTDWKLGSSGPPAMAMPAMVFDAGRGVIVLYGAGQTWERNGSRWTRRATSGPALGWLPAMAYDARRRRTVLLGRGNRGLELWEWDGAAWRAGTPPPFWRRRDSTKIAYDASRRRIVLFGGEWNGNAANDTWTYDGTNWSLQKSSALPAPRARHVFAYDPAAGKLLLFAGIGSGARLFTDTWMLDAAGWTRRARSTGPEARIQPAMAYDPPRRRILLFGGRSANGSLADTWAWDGSGWIELQPKTVPGGGFPALAFEGRNQRVVLFDGTATWAWNAGRSDWQRLRPPQSPSPPRDPTLASFRDGVLLFGGMDSSRKMLRETWQWNGSTWHKLVPKTSPPARVGHGLAHDVVRGRVVLFGGLDTAFRPLNDTWEWDGTDWRQMQPATRPSARCCMSLAYDVARARVVLFGGFDRGDLGDTWEWDGRTWLRRVPTVSPPGRNSHGAAYDRGRREVLLFGGTRSPGPAPAGTWTYAPLVPASYLPFGKGCRGTAGTPALAAAVGRGPWVGHAVRLECTNIPANRAVLFFTGFSNSRWGPIVLPWDLGFLGMTGCSLLASGDLLLPGTTAGSKAVLDLPLPNLRRIVGGRFFNQALVHDPAANRAGLTASNGGAARAGAK